MTNLLRKISILSLSILTLAACNPGGGNQDQNPADTNDDNTGEETAELESDTLVSLADYDVEDQEAFEAEPAGQDTISLISSNNCLAPINVAAEKGFYEEEGLDVELFQSQSEVIDAVGTGQVALGAGHVTSSLIPIINGVDVQYLGPMNTGCKGLYVAGDSDLESAGDMDNLTIGIHGGMGESDHNIALRFLLEEGADPDSVDFVTSDVAATTEAIKNGELDGAIYTENYAAPFVRDGSLKEINSITTDDAFKDEVCCAIYVNKSFIQENPITTKKLLRAIYKANEWAEEDTEAYVDFLYEHDFLSGDEQDGFDFIDSLDYQASSEQLEDTIQKITEDYIELGILEDDVDKEEVLQNVWTPTGLEIGQVN